MEVGTLYIVATPIGNSRDMSERGRQILETVDIIAAEDTRRSVVLLNKLGIRGNSLCANHKFNEYGKAKWFIEQMQQGKSIAVVTAAVLALCRPLREKCTDFFSRRFGDRGVSRKYNNARFARALAMGLSSGLTLEETLKLATLMLSDIPGAAARCGQCADSLDQGESLAEAMGKADLLDAASCRLLSVGLKGGNADRVMGKIADDLAEDASLSLESSISRIEPAMVLTASLLVGAILLTVMLPLMNILSTLG